MMLRRCSLLVRQSGRLSKVSRTSIKALSTNRPEDEEFHPDSRLPKYSPEGIPMRDPRDPYDPSYDNPVGNHATEQFSFDEEKGIQKTAERERADFEEYVSKFGEARFANFVPQIVDRDFEVSQNPEEWKFVERLLPKKLVPQIPNRDRYPSGFQPQKLTAEEALEKHGYFVGRTKNHMLPVYMRTVFVPERAGHVDSNRMFLTTIKKADGNLYKLRKDIDSFLMDRYRREFIGQVAELTQSVTFRGDLEDEVKEFLLQKGL